MLLTVISYEDRPVPEMKDPHNVIVNDRYTGICSNESAGVVHAIESAKSSHISQVTRWHGVGRCMSSEGVDVVIDPSGAELALDMVANGKFSVKELISKTVPFEEAKEAFDNVKRGNGIEWLIEGSKNRVATKYIVF
ncbi:unnamed protein product [Peronospora destructor]|uniref:Alcohol dehydrogenase-like C-terminal domain-containing protein n=1 Tax=Peronospora destructor TaxID=86335 RepID=A0AAV0TI54_9STRA|nr:unnamed protein product [Peronospora destructor]